MVRLQSSESNEGTHPHVVDQLLNNAAAGSKRTRSQTSSLDYKPLGMDSQRGDSNGMQGSGKNVNIVKPEKTPVYEQQQQQRETSVSNKNKDGEQQLPKTTTRARRRDGIPPRKAKLDLNDLEGMPKHEVVQALLDDPELAELASEHMAKQQQQKQNRGSSKGQSNSSRSSSGKTGRIDKVQEKGIPYEQWTIILLLTAFGLYQLYKSVSGPDPTSKKVSGKKEVTTKGKGKRSLKQKKFRNGGENNTSPRSDESETPATTEVFNLDEVVAEIERSVPSKGNTKDKVEKLKVKKVAKKKKKEVDIPVAPKIEQPSTIAESLKKVAPMKAPENVVTIDDYDESSEQNDTWEVVSRTKSKKTAAEPTTVVVQSSAKTESPSLNTDKESGAREKLNGMPSSLESSAAMPKKENQPMVSNKSEIKGSDSGKPNKNKKKSKQKKPKENLPVDSSTVSDADAALALQLQKEEEQLAAMSNEGNGYESFKNSDDDEDAGDWKEVNTRRKKQPSSTETNNAIHSTAETANEKEA